MSYRSVRLGAVLESVVRKRGYDPASATLSDGDRGNVADLVNLKFREVWEGQWWPETMVVEQRQYAPTWSVTGNYGDGDLVMVLDAEDEAHYYRSLADSNVGHDPETDDGTWWELADDDLERSIQLEQSWEDNGIGRIDVQAHVFSRDPRLYRDTAPEEDVYLLGDSILLRGTRAPARPWVMFQLPCPVFSWTDWDVSEGYAAGDVVFVESSGGTTVGEAYVAVAPSTGVDPYGDDGTYWALQSFPAFLRDYVVHAVAAEEIAEDEGRYRMLGLAARILEGLEARLVTAQGTRRRVVYRAAR